MMRRLAWVFLLLFVSEGCSVERSELPGRYRANYAFGSDEIELRSDGTFTQTADATIGGVKKTATLSGAWAIEAPEGSFGERLRLKPMLWVDNGVGQPHPNFGAVGAGGGIMSFGREWGFGRLYLGGGGEHPHRRLDK